MNTLKQLNQVKQSGTLYLSQDTSGWISRIIGRNAQEDPSLMGYINGYFCRLQEILESDFETVEAFDQSKIDTELIKLIGGSTPIVMDRYLLNQLQCDRLELSRYANGSKGPRPGADSIQDQLESLTNTLSNETDVVLVDDGTFSGGSLAYAATILEKSGINISRSVCYFYNPAVAMENFEASVPLKNMIDWIDSRDLSILGGRYNSLSSGDIVTVPYMAPFSDGSSASLAGRNLFPEISRFLIESEYQLFEALDLLGINFGQLKSRGFVPPVLDGEIASDDLSLNKYFRTLLS